MDRFDRRLLYLWFIVTLGAGCAIFQSGIILLLGFTIIGIPLALLIQAMPGAWVYLTPTLAIYLILRRVSEGSPCLVMLAGAAALPLAVGFAIPWWANQVTDQRVHALIAQDHGTPPTIPEGLSITFASDIGAVRHDECWGICQRLLFSRTA